MKKTLVISSLVAASASITLPAAHAEEKHSGLKQFGASSLALAGGAALGGPVGLIVGSISAVAVSQQMNKSSRTRTRERNQLQTEQARRLIEEPLTQPHQNVTVYQPHNPIVEELAQNDSRLHIHFHSGKDDLTPRNLEQINQLAKALRDQPELHVKLLGYADARGTEGYNQVLSEYRTRNVEDYLVRAGVAADRIQREAYGASRSRMRKGDEEGYAQDRYVAVEIFTPSEVTENLAKAY
ncbi:OmpA family protein [Marinimicrobium sp. ABcell2]|uniref:OmpA family protein n=1 Tax=Marinimicrobium sp. ABcell2 TaxID=3069751 RepID=UPI0027B777C0|nr:OmpA family protein [Marinimicrobium sp. ABcell2]MDQ2078149.1 OmpA family protein [Marinimicrobium sp. ABcell2]